MGLTEGFKAMSSFDISDYTQGYLLKPEYRPDSSIVVFSPYDSTVRKVRKDECVVKLNQGFLGKGLFSKGKYADRLSNLSCYVLYVVSPR